MSRRIVTLGLVCLVAAAAGAEEPGGAPLAGAKQELKELQADLAAKNGAAAAGRLTDGLPKIQGPVPGAAQVEMPSVERMAQEQQSKAEAQKNWLLDGVDRLDKTAKGRNRTAQGAGVTLPDGGKDRTDSSAPNYILRLYTDQKKADEARLDQQKTLTNRPDPFAPFLRGWLMTSKAGGGLLDDLARKQRAMSGLAQAVPESAESGFSPGNSGVETVDSAQNPPDPAQANPYLQGLEATAPRDGGTGSSQAGGAIAAASPAPRPSGEGMLAPIPPSRPADKKPPFLATPDDKKYFPQQKKF